MQPFTPSPQQQAIFDFISNDSRSIVIEAVAGSGKTTTIVEAAKLIPPSALSLFLAFNKSIATELQSRLPQNIQAKTFHSHGFAALSRTLPKRPRVDADKVRHILKESLTDKDFFLYGNYCQRLVGYAKNCGIGAFVDLEDSAPWFDLIAYFNMFSPSDNFDEVEAVRVAQAALEESNARTYIIDFDDMLYLTLLKGCTFDKCNFVFLDEAQDTNAVQRALLHRMLAPERDSTTHWQCRICGSLIDGLHPIRGCPGCGIDPREDGFIRPCESGRLIAVGDSAQAIYAFRGASAEAMDEIGTEFRCEKFPLSVSYRCAKSIVSEARKYVSHIEPHPESPLGLVSRPNFYQESDFTPDQVILCRNTAPLVSMAFAFIKRGRGVRILGREIGQGLVTLVKKMNASDVDVVSDKLEEFRRREHAKFVRRGQDSAAEALDDRVACINIFIDALDQDNRTLKELIQRIEDLFNDQSNGGLLTLCSVHKAKGLEWETVNILDKNLYMPSKYAKQPWQVKQETNLIYVAVTRAKHALRFISSGGWKQEKSLVEDIVDETDEEFRRQQALDQL